MNKQLELLAPAGSTDALKAAFANGADAVYLGAPAFGARASVGFDWESLEEALRLAHLFHKKIYVTTNILAKESELTDVRSTLKRLNDLGADAVLVQDLGIMNLCRHEYPDLPVHASTQMALHNASGAEFLKSQGISRIVLARECDLAAIRAAADTGLEVEVFCHGALCVSVSGQCQLSSYIGGRSGNRGRCAQPCRLPYTYRGESGCWLSPRDLCTADLLPEMAEAGAYSFKIEGRLKRPEYVAVVTAVYRRLLDRIMEGKPEKASEDEKEALTQIFSRGAFTTGYIGEHRDAGIIFPERSAPQGLILGKTGACSPKGDVFLTKAILNRALHNGDGFEIGKQEIRYSGPDVPAGEPVIFRAREKTPINSPVRRTEDEKQLSDARASYEGTAFYERLSLPFDAEVFAYPGKELLLRVSDGVRTAQSAGPVCEEAVARALDADTVRRYISKTGGTPYRLRQFVFHSAQAYLSASALNEARRNALEALSMLRCACPERRELPSTRLHRQADAAAPGLFAVTPDRNCIDLLFEAGANEVLYRPADLTRLSLPETAHPYRLLLPVQCTDKTLEHIKKECEKKGIPVCLTSPGQMGAFPDADMTGEGIPVMNSECAAFLYEKGIRHIVLSREISRGEYLSLRAPGDLILPVYGRTRLTVFNHCPARTRLSLDEGKGDCRLCESGQGCLGSEMIDRRNARFPLLPQRLENGCIVEMYADKPLALTSALDFALPSLLVTFTTESPREQQEIASYYAARLQNKNIPAPFPEFTGRFKTGVE